MQAAIRDVKRKFSLKMQAAIILYLQGVIGCIGTRCQPAHKFIDRYPPTLRFVPTRELRQSIVYSRDKGQVLNYNEGYPFTIFLSVVSCTPMARPMADKADPGRRCASP